MFYLLKHLLLLILVIFKLNYNKLILNEIMVLNTLVCLQYSHFIENHLIWTLKDGFLISEMVLSQPTLVYSIVGSNRYACLVQ
jgi:hypothetical protein